MNIPNELLSVAIIGGGPGGLFTAYLLEHKHRTAVDVTIFESSDRVGGKIVTNRFEKTGALYEAGAAELYDYSQIGPDPLRELVEEMGLPTRPMHGRAVLVRDQLIRSDADLADLGGAESVEIFEEFRQRARSLCSPAGYYESDWKVSNEDPLNHQTFSEFLASVPDELVRRYIEVSVHSDVATEPRHTSALYGLQNFLMNEPEYMALYGIVGGIERLPRAVADRLEAEVRLNSPVSRVEATAQGTYLVHSGNSGDVQEFDFVVVALPNYWIPAIDWCGGTLPRAMAEHHAHYDHPAHYLRVTLHFDRAFWREVVDESYFMVDAFGGCCVYDESSRSEGADGVLGWLIGGENAMAMSNLDDAVLIARVLDSLPSALRSGRELFVEGRVHRWVGAVNALPGGFPLRDPDARHSPDPDGNPWLFVVGDYLFDSTLNGVMDSADYVAESIHEEVALEPVATQIQPADVVEVPELVMLGAF